MINPIYIGNTQEKAVALMINVDWGEDIIPDMLQILSENDVKATFFVTGRFAKKFPDVVLNIFEQGHEIGNHGYSHPHPDKITIEKNREEILRTEEALKEIGIECNKVFAPPYGEHQDHVIKAAEELGYKTIMWTLDTVDWQEPAPEKIIEKVISKLDSGFLILMHPKECTLQSLPVMIKRIKNENYLFKTVSEIIS